MHASHVSIENGEFVRYAGNTVFPNGYIDMELNGTPASTKLIVYGDTTETSHFRISINGAPAVDARFDANGSAEFPIPANTSITIRLSKAPGINYPRIRAAVVK